jgi:alpha-1,3-glucan synthase
MLSQFGKTIKAALKSTEEERAMLRARSAVQRFPVVEWRQRTEDFHKRSINMSRNLAGANAWRQSDGGERPMHAIGDHEDWDPVHQPEPSQPEWDRSSVMSHSPRVPQTPQTPGSPGQWSQDTLTAEGQLAPPRIHGGEGRRGSIGTDVSDTESDYFNRASTDNRSENRQEYSNFLDRANKTIAKDNKHAPDPFLEGAAPSRPFGAHNRVSSVESIASIVDEKANSPLNKAMASVLVLFLFLACSS